MTKQPSWVWVVLLLGMVFGACVPTETGEFNPDERLHCQAIMQYNAQDGKLRAEVAFSLADSLERRPYFLDEPASLNGTPMERRFVKGKGIYYLFNNTVAEPPAAVVTFRDTRDRTWSFRIPFGESPLSLPEGGIRKSGGEKALFPAGADGRQTLIFIDEDRKVYPVFPMPQGAKGTLSALPAGKMQVFRSVGRDSSFLLGGEIMVDCRLKTLSKRMEVDVVD